MLTIKWIDHDGVGEKEGSSTESVFEVESVSVVRDKTTNQVVSFKGWRVKPLTSMPSVDFEQNRGTLYVMNDKGTTVATYHIIQNGKPPKK